jgi:hypothetical protein
MRAPWNLHRSGAGVFALGVALVLACESPMDEDARPGWELRPGILLHRGIPSFVQMPDTVARGASFQVAFTTFGIGCDEPGQVRTRVQGSAVEIFPYDWTPVQPPAQPCSRPDSMVFVIPHSAELRVSAIGPATIRIRGRREPGGTAVTLVTSIVVR